MLRNRRVWEESMIAISRMAGSALMLLLYGTHAQASVEISSAPTQNMNCSAGVCSPTSKNAVLNVTDLASMLSSTDVKMTTGAGAVTIGILSPLAWASTHRLTLDANLNINIKAQVMVEGTAGLTIVANDDGTDGDLIFYPGGKIDFWDTSSSLIINGNSYSLVNDIASLASAIANNAGGSYALANDYDASGDGTYPASPVMTKLTGTYEGLGHTISNLSAGGALFAEASGTLRDLGLSNVDVADASLLVSDDAATIIGCSAAGRVSGGADVGGLVAWSGETGGTITRSHSTANVSAPDGPYANGGGLVGASSGITISRSYASGRVHAGAGGGLVGAMYGGLISQSFAIGRLDTGGGGGGLVGTVTAGSIQDSYSGVDLRNARKAGRGGLVFKFKNASVRSSYSTGTVKIEQRDKIRGGFVGVAKGDDDIKWDYWDVDTSGTTQGYGTCRDNNCAAAIEGLRTSQFLSGLPQGFNRKIWAQSPSINNGYPYLIANPPPP